jgi:hypothetical protein
MIWGNALGRSFSPSSNSSWCICFTDPCGSRRKPRADKCGDDNYWIDGYFEETKMAHICFEGRTEAQLMGYRDPIIERVQSVIRGISVSNAAPSIHGPHPSPGCVPRISNENGATVSLPTPKPVAPLNPAEINPGLAPDMNRSPGPVTW